MQLDEASPRSSSSSVSGAVVVAQATTASASSVGKTIRITHSSQFACNRSSILTLASSGLNNVFMRIAFIRRSALVVSASAKLHETGRLAFSDPSLFAARRRPHDWPGAARGCACTSRRRIARGRRRWSNTRCRWRHPPSRNTIHDHTIDAKGALALRTA